MGIEALWSYINEYISNHGHQCPRKHSNHIYFDFTSNLIRIFNRKYKNYTSLYHILEEIVDDVYHEFHRYLDCKDNKLYVFLDTHENVNISSSNLEFAQHIPIKRDFETNQDYDFHNHFLGHVPYVHNSCIFTCQLQNGKIIYEMNVPIEIFLQNIRYQSEIDYLDDFEDYIPLSNVTIKPEFSSRIYHHAWYRWLVKCGAKLETKVERRKQRYDKEYTEYIKENYTEVKDKEKYQDDTSVIFVKMLPDGNFQRYFRRYALPNGKIQENSINGKDIFCYRKKSDDQFEYHPQFVDVLYSFDFIIKRLRERYPITKQIEFFKCAVENDFTIASHIKQNNVKNPTIITSDSDMFVHLCDVDCLIQTFTRVVPGTNTPIWLVPEHVENPVNKWFYIPTRFFWKTVLGSFVGYREDLMSPDVIRLMCVCFGTDYNPKDSKKPFFQDSFEWFKDRFKVRRFSAINRERMINYIRSSIRNDYKLAGKVSMAVNLYLNYSESEFIRYQ